jgi:hypothetical protein
VIRDKKSALWSAYREIGLGKFDSVVTVRSVCVQLDPSRNSLFE